MLAYVFWHAAPENVNAAEYEKVLSDFARNLAAIDCPGFLGNASYAIGMTPWLHENGYEDWNWLFDSAAIDRLNEMAVSGAMEKPHHAIAQMTKHGGFGGLFRLVAGEHIAFGDSKVFWLSRPRGVQWRDAMPDIAGPAPSNVAVWRRQMVLGPSPEFAVIGPPDFTLAVPSGWQALEVQRRRIA
ncbi:MAG TPA: hypothetical protein VFM11_01055 [Burkholderiales bacterium]|nr:hypothetical protein [Burkholderiales bacterium]